MDLSCWPTISTSAVPSAAPALGHLLPTVVLDPGQLLICSYPSLQGCSRDGMIECVRGRDWRFPLDTLSWRCIRAAPGINSLPPFSAEYRVEMFLCAFTIHTSGWVSELVIKTPVKTSTFHFVVPGFNAHFQF